MTQDLIFRLKERARIRRQISSRKSVQEGKPDRLADLLEEAAEALTQKARVVDNTDSSLFESSSASPKVLPSEAAQSLANHLEQEQYRYTEEVQAAIHNDELSWIIQEYWDSLL